MDLLRSAYKYEPLPGASFIRYLILRPGQGDDRLVCSLQTASIDALPPFEAISYVWGDKARTHRLFCDRLRRRLMYITPNLRDALMRMRRPDKPRVLWADSICINQDDAVEQGRQVALMGQIYGRAERVLIFVGVDAGMHGAAVKTLLEDRSKWIHDKIEELRFAEDSFPYPAPDDAVFSDARWESLEVLLRSPWFFRGWVVQEAGLAAEATIFWGDVEFGWLDLVRTFFWVLARAPRLRDAHYLLLNDIHILLYVKRHRSEALVFRPRTYFPDYDFPYILDLARNLDLTDQRDRVYGFLALQPDLSLRPNYETSFLQVYFEFARTYILKTRTLALLDEIVHTEDSLASGIPSWVPRWDSNIHMKCWHNSNPIITAMSSPPTIHNALTLDTLKVRAVLIDSVQFQWPISREISVLDGLLSLWERLPPLSTSVYGLHRQLQAFTQTLRFCTFAGSWKEWVAHEAAFMLQLQQARRGEGIDTDELAALRQRAEDGNLQAFMRYTKDLTQNRSFVMTSRGYYGLGPNAIRTGDVCAIICGTRSPFILRPAAEDGHYQVIGNIGLTSKESEWEEGFEFYLQLGVRGAQDWLQWSLAEEEILLI